ncbi:hypothetical protein R2R35_22860 [Anaerocolumna sp. AGMB13020]|uniref:hypothetical protein n=1 Tax=Anaerocolumna sp. AGMB13020 TaxID=3081750 RepID=UPI002952980E|nr:hypothetical protein [Anaerocolumna sp. AGMB13020]WOO36599.1 hypothetical protein R2R35_22860 [Anaerocolumna sp. AGMB13020]
MDYNLLIHSAIEKNEVIKLIRGEQEYEIVVSEFTSDIFPTDINSVLMNCFYKQKEYIDNIEIIFKNTLDKLLSGNASDVYIAILYFDACIYQEERGKATFWINKEEVGEKIKKSISVNQKELENSIEFCNGMKKNNPWKNIENFNQYYQKKYKISII